MCVWDEFGKKVSKVVQVLLMFLGLEEITSPVPMSLCCQVQDVSIISSLSLPLFASSS